MFHRCRTAITLCAIMNAAFAHAGTVDYRLRVFNDWTQANHKDGAPDFNTVVQPHFSHLGGGTHNANLTVWELGGMSSPGMIWMQESGWIDEPNNNVDLGAEFQDHIANGDAHSFLNWPIPNPWFPAGTETVLQFSISDTHPLLTLVSMLGPSPDWFIGVNGLNLKESGQWRRNLQVDLYPHDGGSRSRDNRFALWGPRESPQQPIRLITDDDDTLLKGSLPIGRFVFELLTLQSDLNGDGAVDASDAGAMFADWGNAGPADLNGDGLVDAADASQMFAEWTGDGTPAAIIPEPSTAFSLFCGLLGLAALVSRRRINCR